MLKYEGMLGTIRDHCGSGLGQSRCSAVMALVHDSLSKRFKHSSLVKYKGGL